MFCLFVIMGYVLSHDNYNNFTSDQGDERNWSPRQMIFNVI